MEKEKMIFELTKEIRACLTAAYENFSDNFDHEYSEETEACGDTYVSRGKEITDESAERCYHAFIEEFTFDTFCKEYLRESDSFNNLIETCGYYGTPTIESIAVGLLEKEDF